ncbi:isoprenylcysteine carboxyl methyltransferase [Amycolatopsis antarctica]|uniref:Isoprenylcysteine carboxyl methyltransferase n=1 Tax=Amycolatopsis antarctica TaxID=1854586 RepID=A0A263CZD1_9PSEU|nr:isoprenylcysteine carboxylmethyltransferase family protein [Amycolatopsis antarctica]OZM70666.1 isoprenylcysteine carboxyl methyltransferase [Amycolatopsis antarctica]
MAVLALVLYVAFLVLAFGVRSVMQWRATGSAGFRGISGNPRSADWWGGVLFVVAVVVGVAAPGLQWTGVLSPVGVLDAAWIQVVGLVLALGGIGATVAAQQSMGRSWRIGVEAAERTELVTGGAFAWVRNPIFTTMVTAALGLGLLAPNVLALAGLVALLLAVQLQVRRVEEPYLLVVHGQAYRDYAARAGRFLPMLGRLPAIASS